MKDTDLWLISDYKERVSIFNKRCGSSYSAASRFLTFRTTAKGVLVGYTVGKPSEVKKLRHDVACAGHPFYWRYDGTEVY